MVFLLSTDGYWVHYYTSVTLGLFFEITVEKPVLATYNEIKKDERRRR